MDSIHVFESLKIWLWELQSSVLLLWKSLLNVVGKPFYWEDMMEQLDTIGIGSLPVILLTSFFTGAVFALQTSDILREYGSTASMGQLVSFTMVRELGPVLMALMFTGRVGAGIASELGGMAVSQQVDALRSLGTDVVKKLVTPRVIACLIALPVLTAIGDFVSIWSGQLLTTYQIHQNPSVYWTSVQQHLKWDDLSFSFFKSIAFAIIVVLIACYQGLKTRGGTRGVGANTTKAVMTASIVIIASDFFLSKLINLFIAHHHGHH